MLELITELTSKLNIDENQAKGGMGLLLGAVKDKVGDAGFGPIASAFGGNLPDLMNAAPKAEEAGGGGLMGMVGKATSALGMGDSKLGMAAGLIGSLGKLGIGAETATKFLPTALGFMQGNMGDTVTNLIKKAFD